jgi:hypothetical protein
MKIKKKHFKRLQEIAEKLNHELNYSGMSLSDLITDIESVQKQKTVQKIPSSSNFIYATVAGNIFDEHRKSVEDCIRKEGEAMVAASTDESTTFKGGLREAVETLAKPKIGDVGYFWDECLGMNGPIRYDILSDINTNRRNMFGTNGVWFPNFSKTPPELK